MGVLEGKVALVTGGSRGVGAAIARSLAQEGAAVVVNYLRSADKAEGVVQSIRGEGGKAIPYGADITDEEAVRGMVRTAVETFGPVDVLVNNALPDYTFDPTTRKDLASVRWEDYLQQLGALRGALYCSQAVVPGMIEGGCGRIISILSNLINNPVVPYHDYTTAKSAFLGFSRNLAAELGPHNNNGQHDSRRPHRRDRRQRRHHRGGPHHRRELHAPEAPRHPGGFGARRPDVRLALGQLRDRPVHNVRRRTGDGLRGRALSVRGKGQAQQGEGGLPRPTSGSGSNSFCGWPEQRDYELIRPLVLFGSSLTERAEKEVKTPA